MRKSTALLRSLGAEAVECGHYCEWFALAYPGPYRYLTHIPNERRDKMEAVRLHAMGVKSGVSDFLMAWPNGSFPGMWLEFKATGRTRSDVSNTQRDWLDLMRQAGFFTGVAFGLDQAVALTTAYLQNAITDEHWYVPPVPRKPATKKRRT